MPLVTRFYETKADALEAISELKKRGLRDRAVQVIDSSTGYLGENTLIKKGVLKKNAARYVDLIKSGKTLLIADVPFASTNIAHDILDTPRSADKGAALSQHEGGLWDDAAPLSSSFGLPALSDKHNPAALSAFFGLPVLAKSRPSADYRGSYGKPLAPRFHPTAALGPLLTKDGKPSGFGFPLLTQSAPTFGGKK